MAHTFSRLANPALFLKWTRVAVPVIGIAALLLLAVGSYLSFFVAPADFRQDAASRIMFVHVPASSMALGVYAMIAISSFIGFVWRHRLADIAAREAAPFGLALTVLSLVTGSLWGRATWSVYWDWDPRLISMLVLAFVYAGYIALWRAVENEAQAARLAALLAMIGAINLPIVRFSVDWWESLHQKASLVREGGPSMDGRMVAALLTMMAGVGLLAGFYTLLRTRTVLLDRSSSRAPRAPSKIVMEPVE